MKELVPLIVVSGYIHIVLGAMHIPFVWKKLFKGWNKDMRSVSYLTLKLINTLLWVVTFLLMVIGFLLVVYSETLSMNSMNLFWLWVSLALFWWWRALWQIITFYKINKRKSKTYLKILTVSMISSFIFNAYVFTKPIWGL